MHMHVSRIIRIPSLSGMVALSCIITLGEMVAYYSALGEMITFSAPGGMVACCVLDEMVTGSAFGEVRSHLQYPWWDASSVLDGMVPCSALVRWSLKLSLARWLLVVSLMEWSLVVLLVR